MGLAGAHPEGEAEVAPICRWSLSGRDQFFLSQSPKKHGEIGNAGVAPRQASGLASCAGLISAESHVLCFANINPVSLGVLRERSPPVAARELALLRVPRRQFSQAGCVLHGLCAADTRVQAARRVVQKQRKKRRDAILGVPPMAHKAPNVAMQCEAVRCRVFLHQWQEPTLRRAPSCHPMQPLRRRAAIERL